MTTLEANYHMLFAMLLSDALRNSLPQPPRSLDVRDYRNVAGTVKELIVAHRKLHHLVDKSDIVGLTPEEQTQRRQICERIRFILSSYELEPVFCDHAQESVISVSVEGTAWAVPR